MHIFFLLFFFFFFSNLIQTYYQCAYFPRLHGNLVFIAVLRPQKWLENILLQILDSWCPQTHIFLNRERKYLQTWLTSKEIHNKYNHTSFLYLSFKDTHQLLPWYSWLHTKSHNSSEAHSTLSFSLSPALPHLLTLRPLLGCQHTLGGRKCWQLSSPALSPNNIVTLHCQINFQTFLSRDDI